MGPGLGPELEPGQKLGPRQNLGQSERDRIQNSVSGVQPSE